jgi:hypothetical protein
VRVIRPGTVSNRRRSVRAVGTGVSGSPISGPAQQVVRERGDHGPGGVGKELAGREVHQGLVFEVTDRELNHGMLAMFCLDQLERVGAVGQERGVAPVWPQLSLGSNQPGAMNDQSLSSDRRFSDLRFTAVGVVLQGLPGGLWDPAMPAGTRPWRCTPIE